jgi:hypothetical protein
MWVEDTEGGIKATQSVVAISAGTSTCYFVTIYSSSGELSMNQGCSGLHPQGRLVAPTARGVRSLRLVEWRQLCHGTRSRGHPPSRKQGW